MQAVRPAKGGLSVWKSGWPVSSKGPAGGRCGTRNDGQGIGSLVSACRLSLRKAGRGSLRGGTGAPAGEISPRRRRRFFFAVASFEPRRFGRRDRGARG